MRKYISSSLLEQCYINNLVLNHEERLKIVEDTFSSFKDLGKKCFEISKIEDNDILSNLLKKL